MYIRTHEASPHLRVSSAYQRIGGESRQRRKERRFFNRLARRPVSLAPRLVKPQTPTVVSMAEFLASARPQTAPVAVELQTAPVATFDKRVTVAQQAGL